MHLPQPTLSAAAAAAVGLASQTSPFLMQHVLLSIPLAATRCAIQQLPEMLMLLLLQQMICPSATAQCVASPEGAKVKIEKKWIKNTKLDEHNDIMSSCKQHT